MKKRGPKAKNKVEIKWSANFAYGIGLIVTDGNLSSDGRHINFTSKDSEQITNFKKSIGINNKIGKKSRGNEIDKKYFVLQFGDINFYQFLIGLGITPAKSKTLGAINIPEEYFFDFLRGCFDGDGYSHSYYDKRWNSSFLFYIAFCSASPKFLSWLQMKIFDALQVKGHITKSIHSSCLQLKYSKYDALKLVEKLYTSSGGLRLSRKYLKIQDSLVIVRKQGKQHLDKNMRGWRN